MGMIAVVVLLCFSLGLANGAVKKAVEVDSESNLSSDSTILFRKVEESRSNSGRIVGGYEAERGEFPWIVSVQWGGQHRCGGFIVNSEWIATNYHSCVLPASGTFTIVAGEHSLGIDEGREQRRNVSLVVPHPGAVSGKPFQNNISLMKLSSPLNFGPYVLAAQLPLDSSFSPSLNLVFTGWGETLNTCGSTFYSPTLRRSTIQLASREVCRNEWSANGAIIGDDMLCAGTTFSKPSSLDQGSPLHSGNTVVGVVTNWFCNLYDGADLYASIPYFVDWIREVTDTPAPSTVSASTSTTPSSTTSSGSTFECTQDGVFVDPCNCQIFHFCECIPDTPCRSTDFSCQPGQIFCQDLLYCSSDACTCDTSSCKSN